MTGFEVAVSTACPTATMGGCARYPAVHHRGDEADELDPGGRKRCGERDRRRQYVRGRVRRSANGNRAPMKHFDFVDVTLRDAHQCLWSTRMTTAMMTPILGASDAIGYS